MHQFARTHGATVFGAEARMVDVQASVGEDGEPAFRLVGLPDSALREGRERIRGAIAHSGWPWPHAPVTVNLAPASARKEGSALDLAVAVAVLAATGVLRGGEDPGRWFCFGELGLDGSLRRVRGALAAVEAARHARLRRAIVPRENGEEAAAVSGVEVVAAASIADVLGHLSGRRRRLPPQTRTPWRTRAAARPACPVRGQPAAVRAAGVAAAGAHNLLLWGPPGAGKTLLARTLAAWLPPPTYEEALAISRVHSVAGLLEGGLRTDRPFRAPHHTTSVAGLVGGGSFPRPGEVSLAHLGVLFLDELAEFPRATLDALRQPLEDGRLVLGRAAGRARFPCDVLLVGATNPCPCGWHGETQGASGGGGRPDDVEAPAASRRCRCSRGEIQRYAARISGPLRDRFDLQVRVGAVDPASLVTTSDGLTGEVPEAALASAQRAQRRRAARLGLPRPANGRLPAAALPEGAEPSREALRFLVRHGRRLGLTGRGVHRVLRVARTIADLAGRREVQEEHLAEALALRTG